MNDADILNKGRDILSEPSDFFTEQCNILHHIIGIIHHILPFTTPITVASPTAPQSFDPTSIAMPQQACYCHYLGRRPTFRSSRICCCHYEEGTDGRRCRARASVEPPLFPDMLFSSSDCKSTSAFHLYESIEPRLLILRISQPRTSPSCLEPDTSASPPGKS